MLIHFQFLNFCFRCRPNTHSSAAARCQYNIQARRVVNNILVDRIGFGIFFPVSIRRILVNNGGIFLPSYPEMKEADCVAAGFICDGAEIPIWMFLFLSALYKYNRPVQHRLFSYHPNLSAHL